MGNWYPGGAITMAPWRRYALYHIPGLYATNELYMEGGDFYIVDGRVCGSLHVDGEGGYLIPSGEGEWIAGDWYFDGEYLTPTKGDKTQIEVTWTSQGVTGKAYVGTPIYYRLQGFNGTSTSGTALIMGEANDPDQQATTTWTYTPPKVWKMSGTSAYGYAASLYGMDAAGLYEPYLGGATGNIAIGQGTWWCQQKRIGVYENAAGTGLLVEPSTDAANVPTDDAKFILADGENGRWVHSGMPTLGQDFTASWEWNADVPQEERVDSPADLSFVWKGYGFLWADNGIAGNVYAYDVSRIM